MATRVGVEPPLAFAGGVARNSGVVRALEDVLGQRLIVPDEPQITGALGAALLARDHPPRSTVGHDPDECGDGG